MKRDLIGVPIGPADAQTALNGQSNELNNNGMITDRNKANGFVAGILLMLRNANGNRNLDRIDGDCWKDSIGCALPLHRVCECVHPRIKRVDDDELRKPDATAAIRKATIALELPTIIVQFVILIAWFTHETTTSRFTTKIKSNKNQNGAAQHLT